MIEMQFDYHKKFVALFLMLVFCFACTQPTSKSEPSLTIFAAASLANVLEEINGAFQAKHQVQIKTNLASSGTLARQIEQGAQADIYLSANQEWAEYVSVNGYISNEFQSVVAENELALIAPATSSIKIPTLDSLLDFQGLLGAERLSMGDPAHVPAGRYAKQALEQFGWYEALQILPGKDVRAALMVVELGESPLGIVYRTDALKSEKVNILQAFPPASHDPIVYVAGLCSKKELAKAYYQFLQSDEAKAIWSKFGFN